MAEKGTIFEQIKEKIDEVIMGRRYLISEIGKLKVSMEKLQGSLPNVADLDRWLTEVKTAVASMGQLTPVLNQLADSAGAIRHMQVSIEGIQKSIQGMGNLAQTANVINQAAVRMGELEKPIREIKDQVRGFSELKEGFEAALGIMGELKIAMGGLKGTMDTLSNSFEGIAGLADLGSLAKSLKPSIEELRGTMASIKGLKGTLSEISKSAQSLADLKVLVPELKASMSELRSSVRSGVTIPSAAPVSPVSSSSFAPKPAASSTGSGDVPSRFMKPLTSGPKKTSAGPLKATRTAAKAAPAVAKPISAKPASAGATKPGAAKKGKTPPIVLEVFDLIEQRAQRGESAQALAKIIENGRDTISKSWKWHPLLYEVGTFARKLKKYPPNKAPDQQILKVLYQKIEEWKEKMVEEK
ncbi:MAG: hypothetical protein ACTSRW_13425 [Candidatus Helarchaeota archaeon]